MKLTDVTGKIKNGMWSYGPPFPEYKRTLLTQPDWVTARVWCDVFNGMNSQTGTYLETPAHYLGPDKSYNLEKVPLEKLVGIRASHIKLPRAPFLTGGRVGITREMLEEHSKNCRILENDALIFSCSWGKGWFEKSYLESSPYLTRGAMEWLIEKKPFILASDVPRWDRTDVSEGFWGDFYGADILMLAPLVNLENVGTDNLLLTVLPLNIADTSCAPCRAFITEG
ncbi:MAG: cyclase family protein [Clostridia bacterium]|nr:cyclase family protein [Clostridia bacterium]